MIEYSDKGVHPLVNIAADRQRHFRHGELGFIDHVLYRLALVELGGRCQTLLELLYQTDPPPSYAEIAARLQVSVGAIGPTRARCLQKLKKLLEAMDF